MRKDLLCRLWRHDTEYYVYGQKIGRWGQLIDKYGPRCKRCHCTGDATYERGLFELVPRTYFLLRHSAMHLFRRWLHKPCHDCGKPEILFGRKVGRHPDCIPF